MKRLPPSEHTEAAVRELLREGLGEGAPTSDLVKLAVRQIVEEALQGVVSDVLGRGYYERRGDRAGYRNGYRQGRLATSEGAVSYAVPQLRDVQAPELSKLRELLGGRTEELERLAVEMYARGCSTRDIEAIFADEQGRSLLSRSAVSEITETLWEQYEEFATRDLSSIPVLYLFLDGIAEKFSPGARREAVLCAWAITEDGAKVLVNLAPGTKESTDCCKDFLQDLRRRGLPEPVLVATDGAAGFIRAVEECFPSSLRQRCLAHKIRNICNKLPEDARAAVKGAARAAYQAPSQPMAQLLRDDLVERFGADHPAAVRCFQEDFEACIAHLQCPPSHRRVTRTTNLLERLFGEERRRFKAVGTMFGERPVLKLMYAAVIRAADTWRGIRISEFERRQIEQLREQLRLQPSQPVNDQGSEPKRVYSTPRT